MEERRHLRVFRTERRLTAVTGALIIKRRLLDLGLGHELEPAVNNDVCLNGGFGAANGSGTGVGHNSTDVSKGDGADLWVYAGFGLYGPNGNSRRL